MLLVRSCLNLTFSAWCSSGTNKLGCTDSFDVLEHKLLLIGLRDRSKICIRSLSLSSAHDLSNPQYTSEVGLTRTARACVIPQGTF